MVWAEANTIYYVGAAFVLAYIACNILKEREATRWVWLKPLFLFASLLILVTGFGALREIGENAGDANAPADVLEINDISYRASLYTYLTFGFLFALVLIIEIAMLIKFKRKEAAGELEEEDGS